MGGGKPSARWAKAGVSYCQNCGARERALTMHHVVYQQEIRRHGGDLWDPRNAMTLCEDCHTRHHRRFRPLYLDRLPDGAFIYARELLGAGQAYGYLRRRYGGLDDRLNALALEADHSAAGADRSEPKRRARDATT